MNHKISINIEFILRKEDDLSSFDQIAQSMREAFAELGEHDHKDLKFNLNIESLECKLEDIKI